MVRRGRINKRRGETLLMAGTQPLAPSVAEEARFSAVIRRNRRNRCHRRRTIAPVAADFPRIA
jgi:hypothetical protein